MRNKVWLGFMTVMLVAGLWLAPVRHVTAQEEAETTEEQPQGAGPIILLMGIGALGLVGAYYAAQQASGTNKKEVE